jgi:hypothetical protein
MTGTPSSSPRPPYALVDPSLPTPEEAAAFMTGAHTISVREWAAQMLLDPYLTGDPDGWHLIDNANADDLRHALEEVIERVRSVLALPDRPTVTVGERSGRDQDSLFGFGYNAALERARAVLTTAASDGSHARG